MRCLVIGGAVLLIAVGSSAAQQRVEHSEVLESAVQALLEGRDQSRVVIAATDDRPLAEAVGLALGIEVRDKSAVILCSEGVPASCRISGAAAVVMFGKAQIREEDAEVTLGLATADLGHLAQQVWTVRLRKKQTGWAVIEKRLVLET